MIIIRDKKCSTIQVWLNIQVGNIVDKAISINNIALRFLARKVFNLLVIRKICEDEEIEKY